MTEVLDCGRLLPGCRWRGEAEEELMREAAIHAAEAQDMTVTPELAKTVRGAIRAEG